MIPNQGGKPPQPPPQPPPPHPVQAATPLVMYSASALSNPAPPQIVMLPSATGIPYYVTNSTTTQSSVIGQPNQVVYVQQPTFVASGQPIQSSFSSPLISRGFPTALNSANFAQFQPISDAANAMTSYRQPSLIGGGTQTSFITAATPSMPIDVVGSVINSTVQQPSFLGNTTLSQIPMTNFMSTVPTGLPLDVSRALIQQPSFLGSTALSQIQPSVVSLAPSSGSGSSIDLARAVQSTDQQPSLLVHPTLSQILQPSVVSLAHLPSDQQPSSTGPKQPRVVSVRPLASSVESPRAMIETQSASIDPSSSLIMQRTDALSTLRSHPTDLQRAVESTNAPPILPLSVPLGVYSVGGELTDGNQPSKKSVPGDQSEDSGNEASLEQKESPLAEKNDARKAKGSRSTSCSCSICGKVLKSSILLRRHVVQMHESVPKFTCHICQRRFKRKDNLQSHLRTHSSEMPYECSYCGKKFRFQSGHAFHVRTKHSASNSSKT